MKPSLSFCRDGIYFFFLLWLQFCCSALRSGWCGAWEHLLYGQEQPGAEGSLCRQYMGKMESQSQVWWGGSHLEPWGDPNSHRSWANPSREARTVLEGVPDRCSLSACYCPMAPLSNDEAIRAPTLKNVISCFLFLIFSFLILLGGSLKSRLR